jgi:hypothetical protein
MTAHRSQLVRLPAGKVHVLPAYSARTLCGMTEYDTARMTTTATPPRPGLWCGWCHSEVAVVSAVVASVPYERVEAVTA